MLRQIRDELYKMLRKPRTYLGFAAFLIINILVLLGLKYSGVEGIIAHGSTIRDMQIAGSPINAIFFCWLVVGSPFAFPILAVWMPFFASVVSGEIVAGEYVDGTLRALLVRPIGRLNVLWSKFVVSVIYCVALSIFLASVSYLFGWIWFGRGGLFTIGTFDNPMMAWFSEPEALARVAAAYFISTVFVVSVTSIAFFISVWLNNAVGAIGATMMLIFLLALIGEIPYFQPIKPYFCTNYVFLGQNLFVDPIPYQSIGRGLLILGVYIAVFLGLSMVIFSRKDVHA